MKPPTPGAERDDYAIQLEVERKASGKPIAANRHDENDDQDQRDQAVPADGGRASDCDDGGDGQRQGEDADPSRAQNTEGEQPQGRPRPRSPPTGGAIPRGAGALHEPVCLTPTRSAGAAAVTGATA